MLRQALQLVAVVIVILGSFHKLEAPLKVFAVHIRQVLMLIMIIGTKWRFQEIGGPFCGCPGNKSPSIRGLY